MKICDVVQFHSDLSGGVKRYIHGKMRYLQAQPGVDHTLVIPSAQNRVTHLFGSRVHEVRSPPLPGSKSYRALVARKHILDIIEDERPDVIETDSPYRSALIALEAARRIGARTTAFYHSDFPRSLEGTMQKHVGRHVAHLLARRLNRYLLDLYNRANATFVAAGRYEQVLERLGIRSVIRVALSVDPAEFQPAASRDGVRSKLGLDPNTTLLLYVGRIAREKNIGSLLAMMDCFRPEDGPVHLVLVGDGEQHRRVRRLAASRDNITWLGYCGDTSRLCELYTAADLLVHAGCSETFGLVSLEAQACGTRVLAVSGGGLDETLEHEPVSVLAESAHPRHLAVAVARARALDESEEDRRLRRERTTSLFNPAKTYGRILSVYESLCSDTGSGPTETLDQP